MRPRMMSIVFGRRPYSTLPLIPASVTSDGFPSEFLPRIVFNSWESAAIPFSMSFRLTFFSPTFTENSFSALSGGSEESVTPTLNLIVLSAASADGV